MEITKRCKVTNDELSTEKKYSEYDISVYIASHLKNVMCGDYFAESPWGLEENKRLYCALAVLNDKNYGIEAHLQVEKAKDEKMKR